MKVLRSLLPWAVFSCWQGGGGLLSCSRGRRPGSLRCRRACPAGRGRACCVGGSWHAAPVLPLAFLTGSLWLEHSEGLLGLVLPRTAWTASHGDRSLGPGAASQLQAGRAPLPAGASSPGRPPRCPDPRVVGAAGPPPSLTLLWFSRASYGREPREGFPPLPAEQAVPGMRTRSGSQQPRHQQEARTGFRSEQGLSFTEAGWNRDQGGLREPGVETVGCLGCDSGWTGLGEGVWT